MNRTLKFRARAEGKWYYFTLNELRRHSQNVPHHIYEYSDDSILISEWTGLKDKNGTDIYEGDIIYWIDAQNKFEVFWNSKLARFGRRNKNGETFFNQKLADNSEVVGNIYEHPHLISSKQEE